MKACGKMIKEMAKDLKDMLMAIHTTDISAKAKLMEKEFILGLMANNTLDIGKTIKGTELVPENT